MAGDKVLIIDDDEAFVDAAIIYLSDYGLDVIKAYRGADALRVSAEEVVDIAIVDVHLPDGDGVDLAGQIRRLQPHAPVICISSDDTPEVLHRCAQIGACVFVAKPINPRSLLDIVSRTLRGHARARLRPCRCRTSDLVA